MAAQYLQLSESSLAIGLLTLLTGYVGADIAPDTIIERLLWPQRFSNGFNAGSIKNALFLSAGGPLHGTAIRAIDTFFKHGLQKGPGRGHLLGTALFPDTGISYKMYPGNGKPVEEELVRNGLLVRILKCMSDTSALISRNEAAASMRQQINVSHLEMFHFDNIPPQGAIDLDAAEVNARTIIALLASEMPTMILAIVISYLWNIPAGLLYLLPAFLKVLSAYTAVRREDLIIPHHKGSGQWQATSEVSQFEVHIPGEGFQVISGPSDLVLPFFRHYGHPIRCRWREITQMAIVAAMGVGYPVTFVITMIFMSLKVQMLWAGYQVMLLFTMLAARYGGGELWGSTEERIAKALLEAEKAGGGRIVVLKNNSGGLVGARLTRTLHGSYTEGKNQVAAIVSS
ncbi:hypothetical protein BDV96DRAFT_561302 [Lophiotrema nucula]|uniref:Uncharacterized protein n=1 Tax=Lophiotrema nucula TaxID=690887 RepID=A0A6A5ZSR1_9PLEO|nr:hypothetical protein BDV96DRAFT_561302 [Lophiotrema nucula]